MAKTNAERQADYRERQRTVGRCSTGGCEARAHPYRKCAACRQREAAQKRAKRQEVAEDLQALDPLRERVRELEEKNAWLEARDSRREERIAGLEKSMIQMEQLVKVMDKYNVLGSDFEDVWESRWNDGAPYGCRQGDEPGLEEPLEAE